MKPYRTTRYKRPDGTEAVYHYHRDTGRRIEGTPGTPLFQAKIRELDREFRARFSAGALSELIRKFEASTTYEKLAETTKVEYRRKFKIIDAKWGSCPVVALTDLEFKRDVLAWHEKLAKKTPREADNLVLALSRVLSYAVQRAMITVNILDKLQRAYHADRSDIIWLPEDVERFLANANEPMQTALMLGTPSFAHGV